MMWSLILVLNVVSLVASMQMSMTKPQTVWTTFGGIAASTGATNLGQGFPDWNPPKFVLDSLKRSYSHQYTRPAGHLQLVELLADRYSKHLSHQVDPISNVAVTVGASQALYLSLITLLKEQDEIVIFEPFFELYTKQIKLTGATPKFVPLGGSAATLEDPWALNEEALRKAITPNTKIILLNSPHNPTGKVFSLKELEVIAQIVRENPNIIVISDEVYKFTIYNPSEAGDSTAVGHYHFARLPDMWDRTLTISSCGKTFSVTGWQVGWMVGPEKFVLPVQEMLPCVQFCAATPIQEALSYAITTADEPYEGYSSYYEWLRQQFSSKRATLEAGLIAAGLEPMPSNGGFFLMAKLPIHRDLMQQLEQECQLQDLSLSVSNDASTTPNRKTSIEPYDWRYLRRLASTHRVIGIPASPFFRDGGDSQLQLQQQQQQQQLQYTLPPMGRFAFCKTDQTIQEAAQRLKSSNRNAIDVKAL